MLPGFDIVAEGGNFGPSWPEVMPMETAKTEARELTWSERAAIRKLVTGMCADYDPEYGCLPLDCPCYMLNKWWTGAYCRYFQKAVLPLDSALEAALTDNGAARKICPVCGAAYVPVTSQARIARKLAGLWASVRQTADANGTGEKAGATCPELRRKKP